jgi:hypothetical protein
MELRRMARPGPTPKVATVIAVLSAVVPASLRLGRDHRRCRMWLVDRRLTWQSLPIQAEPSRELQPTDLHYARRPHQLDTFPVAGGEAKTFDRTSE